MEHIKIICASILFDREYAGLRDGLLLWALAALALLVAFWFKRLQENRG